MLELTDDWCRAKASTFLCRVHVVLSWFSQSCLTLFARANVPFHCLAYNASFDSFLDDHGQVFADVFFFWSRTKTLSKSRRGRHCEIMLKFPTIILFLDSCFWTDYSQNFYLLFSHYSFKKCCLWKRC